MIACGKGKKGKKAAAAVQNSLTLHVAEFASLLLQLLLQGVALLLQARQSFSPLELLAGHLDPERRTAAPGSSATQPAGFQVSREEVEGDTVVSQQRVKTRSSGWTPLPLQPLELASLASAF